MSALQKKLDAILAIAPAINFAVNEANDVVKHVEKVLVQDAKIGISALTAPFRQGRGAKYNDADDTWTEIESRSHLGFGRVKGSWCVYVHQTDRKKDEAGKFDVAVGSDDTPWASLDRETRLEAFGRLPELLDAILAIAQKAAETAGKTTAALRELTANGKVGIEGGPRVTFKGSGIRLPRAQYNELYAEVHAACMVSDSDERSAAMFLGGIRTGQEFRVAPRKKRIFDAVMAHENWRREQTANKQ